MKQEIISSGEGLHRFRKIHGGTFRLTSGKIIKPNEVFVADFKDIPVAFRDMVEDLGLVAEKSTFSSTRSKGKQEKSKSIGIESETPITDEEIPE